MYLSFIVASFFSNAEAPIILTNLKAVEIPTIFD